MRIIEKCLASYNLLQASSITSLIANKKKKKLRATTIDNSNKSL